MQIEMSQEKVPALGFSVKYS